MKMRLVWAAALTVLSSHAAFAGDTWSQLEPKSSYVSLTESLKVATTAPLSSLQHENPGVYGTPVHGNSADRVVRLAPDSHSMNVEYGESVEFVVPGENGAERSFAWRFDGSPSRSYVELSEVAAAGFPDRNFRVFVAPDTRYSGE
jgi:hypothetical protein